MIGKDICGTDECYVCGKILNWEKTKDVKSGQVVVYNLPEISADAYAVGKNEDGTVLFEIICTCPKCKSKNKFMKNVEIPRYFN